MSSHRKRSSGMAVVCIIILLGCFGYTSDFHCFRDTTSESTYKKAEVEYMTETYEIVSESTTPEYPVIEGEGGNLTATSIYTHEQNKVIATNTDNVTAPTVTGEGSIHVSADIDSVTGYGSENIVPYGTFTQDFLPSLLPPGWSWQRGVTSGDLWPHWASCAIQDWYYYWQGFLFHEIRSAGTIGIPVSNGWVKTTVTTGTVRTDIPYASATLRFDRRVTGSIYGWTGTDNTVLRVSLDGQQVWTEVYGFRDYSWDTGWQSVSVDVSSLITPGQPLQLEIYSSTSVGTDIFLQSSEFESQWDNIKLDVTYVVPTDDPESIYINDPLTGNHYFDWRGHLEFDTSSEYFTFGPANRWFEMNVTLTTTRQEELVTYYTIHTDTESAVWRIFYNESDVGWHFDRCIVTVPSMWTYESSSPGSKWGYDSFTHTLWFRASCNHTFTSPLSSIYDIKIGQQYEGTLLREECVAFMREEQFAVTPLGYSGINTVNVTNSMGNYEFFKGWLNHSETLFVNATGQYLTIDQDAPYGNYTVHSLCYNNVTHDLGYKTASFIVGGYEVSNFEVTETGQGNLSVSGSIVGEGVGNPNVYVVCAYETVMSGVRVWQQISSDFTFDYWRMDDCLIYSGGESVGMDIGLYNEGLTDTDVNISVRAVSVSDPTFTLFQIEDNKTFSSGHDTWTIDHWIGNPGYNTTLRRGIYRIEIALTASVWNWSVFADQLDYYERLYVVITDDPDLDGDIVSFHTADVVDQDFSTIIDMHEVYVPGNNHFIAVVEDAAHITSETQAERTQDYGVLTVLTDPDVQQYQDGSLYVAARMMSSIVRADFGVGWPYDVEFYVDWGHGYEFLGSDPVGVTLIYTRELYDQRSEKQFEVINNLAEIFIDPIEGRTSGTYPLRIVHEGTHDTQYCELESEFPFTALETTPTTQPDDFRLFLVLGAGGVLGAITLTGVVLWKRKRTS